MEKEAAEIIAAAMNNMAAASALQAETNAVLAGEVNGLRRTVQAQQAQVERKIKPLIERSKAQVNTVLRSLEEVPGDNADS